MAVYHLKVGFGSRAGRQSASAKNDYIEREGRYAEPSPNISACFPVFFRAFGARL